MAVVTVGGGDGGGGDGGGGDGGGGDGDGGEGAVEAVVEVVMEAAVRAAAAMAVGCEVAVVMAEAATAVEARWRRAGTDLRGGRRMARCAGQDEGWREAPVRRRREPR